MFKKFINLNVSNSLLYWTEVGSHSGVFEARMNGQNARSLVKNEESVPNGVFFNPNSEKILVVDGSDINVKSYAPKGKLSFTLLLKLKLV